MPGWAKLLFLLPVGNVLDLGDERDICPIQVRSSWDLEREASAGRGHVPEPPPQVRSLQRRVHAGRSINAGSAPEGSHRRGLTCAPIDAAVHTLLSIAQRQGEEEGSRRVWRAAKALAASASFVRDPCGRGSSALQIARERNEVDHRCGIARVSSS